MEFSHRLRWAAVVAWVPLGFAIGFGVSEVLGAYTGHWSQYFAGMLCPVLIIGGTWKLAPAWQRIACVAAYAVMLIAWWHFLSPATFPEGHPQAHEPTHKPFYTAVIFSFFCLIGLLSQSHDLGDQKSHPGVGGPDAFNPDPPERREDP